MKNHALNSVLFSIILIIASIWNSYSLSADYVDKNIKDEYRYKDIMKTLNKKALPYCEDWSPFWPYKVKKEYVISTLYDVIKEINEFSKAKPTYKSNILTGLMWHYLFQMHVDSAYSIAERIFMSLTLDNPNQIEACWFRGYHMITAGKKAEGMEILDSLWQSQKIEIPRFWEDYSKAALIAEMKFRSFFGMNQYKSLTGKECDFGKALEKRTGRLVMNADINSAIPLNTIWETWEDGDAVRWKSYLLGISFKVPKSWTYNLNPYDLRSKLVTIGLNPPKLPHKDYPDSLSIGIVLLFDMSSDLKAFRGEYDRLKNCNADTVWRTKELIEFDAKGLRYTLNRKLNKGFDYIGYIAFEKDCPKYPGFVLEKIQKPLGDGSTGQEIIQITGRHPKRIGYSVNLFAPIEYKEKAEEYLKDILKDLTIE